MEQNYIRSRLRLSIESKNIMLHDVSEGEYELLMDFLRFIRSSKFGTYIAKAYFDPTRNTKKIDVESSERLRYNVN